MGLSSKQVSRDGVLGWNQALLQAHTLELPKPPPSMKRQQPTNQPQQAEPLKCPRCDSANTKFCYYNNYNKSQPRHFCKACKRHWTKGGTLRNVPVGGGRKNKRLKTSNAAAAAETTTVNNNWGNNTDVGIQCDQPPMIRQNLGFAFGDQKNLSEILYRATIHHHHQPPPVPSSSNLEMKDRICSSTTVSPPSQNQNQSLLFLPYSTSTSFDTTSSSIYAGETLDDPTITSTSFMPTTTCSTVISTQPWQLSTTISNSTAMEYSTSYWNWDDIDTFASTDLINIPNWVDDSHDHIKP